MTVAQIIVVIVASAAAFVGIMLSIYVKSTIRILKNLR